MIQATTTRRRKGFPNRLRQRRETRQRFDRLPQTVRNHHAQDPIRRQVRHRQSVIGVKCQHRRTQARQHPLKSSLRLFEITLVIRHLAPRLLKLARHQVKRLREDPQLVAPAIIFHWTVVAFRDGSGSRGQHGQGSGQPA